MSTKIGGSTIFKAETGSCWPQEKLEHSNKRKISSYSRLDTLDTELLPTNKLETYENMTQEFLMMNLNKSSSSLIYPVQNVDKTNQRLLKVTN